MSLLLYILTDKFMDIAPMLQSVRLLDRKYKCHNHRYRLKSLNDITMRLKKEETLYLELRRGDGAAAALDADQGINKCVFFRCKCFRRYLLLL